MPNHHILFTPFSDLERVRRVTFRNRKMKQYSLVHLVLSVVATLTLGTAQAAPAPLKSQMDVYRVEHKDGKEVLVKAGETSPDSMIEYHLTYTNNSDKPLSIKNIAVPVPESTAYIARSANTSVAHNFQVSLDGGNSWSSEPVKRMAKDKNDKDIEVVVPVSEYTHLRWQEKNSIKPGEVQEFRYRVRVL